MMTGRDFIMKGWHFHGDSSRFSWWQVEIFVITCRNFIINVQTFMMAARDFFNRSCSRGSLFSMLFLVVNVLKQFNAIFLVHFVFKTSISKKVYGKTTSEWQADDIRVHKSDIRMICDYTRVTYGWHMNGIRVTYENIRMTYEWRTMNDMKNIKLHKAFGAFRSKFSTLFSTLLSDFWLLVFLVT